MKKTLDTLANALTTPATAQTQEATAPAKEEAVVRTINIYYFEYADGKLIVKYFRDNRRYRATAHPALKVSPLMHKDIEAVVYEHSDGYKLLTPCPTKAEIEAYNAHQTQHTAEPQKKVLTESQLAYLASF